MRSSVATMMPPRSRCLVTVQTYAERERFLQRRQQLEQQHAAQVSAGLALSAARERGLRVERNRQDAQEAEREVTRLVRRNGPRHPPPPLPCEGTNGVDEEQVDGEPTENAVTSAPVSSTVSAVATSSSATASTAMTPSSSTVSVTMGGTRVVSKPPLPTSAITSSPAIPAPSNGVSTFQARLRPVQQQGQQQLLSNRTPSPAPYCPTPDYDSDSSGSTLHTASTTWTAEVVNGHVNGQVNGAGPSTPTTGRINGHVNSVSNSTPVSVHNARVNGYVNGLVNGASTSTPVSVHTARVNGHVNGASSSTPVSVHTARINGNVNGASSSTPVSVNTARVNGHVNGHVNGASPSTPVSTHTTRVNGHVNGRGGQVKGSVSGAAPEVEMQSLDSMDLLEPRAMEPRPPQTYFAHQAKTSPRPSVCVTIREYGAASSRQPSKLTFLSPQSKNHSQQDAGVDGLQSELASTLSRSNLSSRTDVVDASRNGHPKEAEEAPKLSEEVTCGNITVTSVNGTTSSSPYSPKGNMPNGILKKAVSPMTSNGIPVGHGITPAILAGAGAALNKTKTAGIPTKSISFGAKATIINEKQVPS